MTNRIPVNTLKIDAYKGIAKDYNAAVDILLKKQLIYGQPAIVPYYNKEKVYGLFAVGGADSQSVYAMSDLINNYRYVDASTGAEMLVGDILHDIVYDTSTGYLKKYVDEQDASVFNAASRKIQENYDTLSSKISTLESSVDASIRDVSVYFSERISEVDEAHSEEEQILWENFNNFYKKNLLYTRDETDEKIRLSMLALFRVVKTLPTASAETMGHIYLIRQEPEVQGEDAYYIEYVTLYEMVGYSYQYFWAKIGNTKGDLSNYYTKAQVNALLEEKESVSNRVTVIDASSTHDTYPTAKAVYDSNPLTAGSGTNTAVLKGTGTVATNDSETALGTYNISNDSSTNGIESTLFSVGCGTSDTSRKNAIEVNSDGDVFIKGVGNYDGTNPDKETNSIGRIISDVDSRFTVEFL